MPLINACRRALDYKIYNYKIIQKILEKGLDMMTDETDDSKHLPEHHNPLPELDHVGPAKQAIPQDAFRQAQASGQFRELKKAFRGFAFPMTAAFLIWYFAYVLLSVYARGFMATPVIGNVNLGTIMVGGER